MTATPTPDDLSGTVDEQQRQLAALVEDGELTAEWLLRQLQRTQAAWAADDTTLDIEHDSRVDY
ncbi:hypothetical protein ITJ43_09575 [Microbacterium sp. VKM Ac-2870]|uniref:hypothetical protein n=1 Tax=Microbacterium sp. VKM Ac-2870 TaxID=2783825 RepID=UPI00188C323D|nr:hypothetical protein [Microbacterium sp. VKM Ac-2870]MBF4562391.1 hypothetical protein [Microbacterium sp. VKM Ac-2870]